jgi:hypothetical protein
MIERIPQASERQVAASLVAWWLVSTAVLAVVFIVEIVPLDDHVWSASVSTLGMAAAISVVWWSQGFVLGGWKALLVALGRASLRTRRDKVWLGAFAIQAFGWPIFVVASAIAHHSGR